MHAYGISNETFEVPPPDGEVVAAPEIGPNVTKWKESTKVADACYDYFEDLSLSQEYADLLARIGGEVFHILFQNREALTGLNRFISMAIDELEPDMLQDVPRLAVLFMRSGRLKRVEIPIWVQRAVFFRERGRCAQCGTDISGLLDALPQKQFHHIIPLARGGLNDITNIQLLCSGCNAEKSDQLAPPSRRYRRWFAE
jgi:HNH endonuclease